MDVKVPEQDLLGTCDADVAGGVAKRRRTLRNDTGRPLGRRDVTGPFVASEQPAPNGMQKEQTSQDGKNENDRDLLQHRTFLPLEAGPYHFWSALRASNDYPIRAQGL